MLRMMMAALALIVAAQAAAQTSELPVWLIGNWCLEQGKTKACVRYEEPVDGKIRATNIRIDDGVVTNGTTSMTAIEDGRIVRRGTNGTVVREISHGPNEMLLEVENPTATQARRIRYSVRGDELTLEFFLPDGTTAVQRYKREPVTSSSVQ
ncbi:MAG: hypothetical protein ACAH11_14525 [Sphingomonas sp.]